MRDLTPNDIHAISGGEYSAWQTIGIATVSNAIAMGSINALMSGSIKTGLQAAGACGLTTTLTAMMIVGGLELIT